MQQIQLISKFVNTTKSTVSRYSNSQLLEIIMKEILSQFEPNIFYIFKLA